MDINMAANIPNMGNINTVASNTKSEFVDHAKRHLTHRAHKSQRAHEMQLNQQRRAAQQQMDAAQRMGRMHDAALNEDTRRTQAAGRTHEAALRENTKRNQAHTNSVQAAGRMHEAALREDQRRTAAKNKPAQMAQQAQQNMLTRQRNEAHTRALRDDTQRTNAAQKAHTIAQNTITKQRNEAHGHALRAEAQRNTLAQKNQATQQNYISRQRNSAHSQAIKETSRPDTVQPYRVGTPRPIQSRKPILQQGSADRDHALGNITEGLNTLSKRQREFPQHQHPEGSSQQVMPHITARQPRTNEFTVGSRHATPGGIAAKGSQLEAWANTKTQAVRARNASKAAGGRDKNLANTAKNLEDKANRPLSEFE